MPLIKYKIRKRKLGLRKWTSIINDQTKNINIFLQLLPNSHEKRKTFYEFHFKLRDEIKESGTIESKF